MSAECWELEDANAASVKGLENYTTTASLRIRSVEKEFNGIETVSVRGIADKHITGGCEIDLEQLIKNPGKTIRKWRQAQGLSMPALAREIHYSHYHIADIENGHVRPSLRVLQGILDFRDRLQQIV